jgi:LmbE family N-acetylglucosaminyl deacetylase
VPDFQLRILCIGAHPDDCELQFSGTAAKFVDYHPDHRYTAQLVQDSAYLVVVPNICPDVAPLRPNPVFPYLEDQFHRPVSFAADIAVDIGDVWDRKIDALDPHASQFYDWLPWVDGISDQVPQDPLARRRWLSNNRSRMPCGPSRAALARRYEPDRAREIQHAEAFELCEYGRRPSPADLEEIFPR